MSIPGSIIRVPERKIIDTIEEFVKNSVDLSVPAEEYDEDDFWVGLKSAGTELWLDTGDMDGAQKLWNREFSALTTNNTLLNAEIQKGFYDGLVPEADRLLEGLDIHQRIIEIAFVLNAHHALRLVRRFGARVSVELHTALADDIETTVAYAERFYRICPSHFIIKIPHTPSGLLATRQVRARGIPVNYTLEFSARTNYIATAIARPDYVNVFLGRLNSFVADNNLGSGEMVGEKATLASQRAVTRASGNNPGPTKQIAASMRSARQVSDLAGVDVFTMPLKVAQAAKDTLDNTWHCRVDEDYPVELFPGIAPEEIHLEKLWHINENEEAFVKYIRENTPSTTQEIMQALKDHGIHDFFPAMTSKEKSTIASDGKIPEYDKWKERIKQGTLAVDSLVNLAGLASFATDQAALDTRIKSLITK
ncbi:MAG: transaldolase [Chitinivibrionales bacterium]|nr:transaldolase [Chitinivibrionales bacterium]